MKLLLIQYKAVIKFILTFLLVYMVLSFTYKFYIQYSNGLKFYPDYFTHLVSKQTEALLNTFGYHAEVIPHPDEPSMKLIINDSYLARIIEGCNGMSVIILFIAFIVAFAGTLKTTCLYILSGSVIIYVFNVLRIVALVLGIYYYPDWTEFMHSVLFPAIIYGTLFLLWIFWVNRFSKLNHKT